MSNNASQAYANHVRLHPPFHFFLLPGSAILAILTIVNVVRNPGPLSSWILLLGGLLAPVAVVHIRVYALKVQDRVIRLEERMRCWSLLSEPLRSRANDLAESQLIALRFASDGELPGLVQKTLDQKMTNGDIKKAISNWRSDTFRV
jgi:hypothetical protein